MGVWSDSLQAICLAFMETDSVSMGELKEMTGMTDEYLELNVDCLITAGILKRSRLDLDNTSPRSCSSASSDSVAVLSLNLEYAPKKPRIKILAPVRGSNLICSM